MATNLLELTKSYFTPDLIQKVSTLVGENPTTTQKAIEGTIPTLLAGLANCASSGTGTTQLSNLLNQGDYGSLLNKIPSLLGGGSDTQDLLSSGRTILSTLFGGKLSAVINLIANFSGIKSNSASSLLSLMAPMLLGVLSKEQAAQGLGSAGLTSLLLGQKDFISRLAPAGLASTLGLNSLADLGSNLTRPAPRAASAAVREKNSLWQWLVPALGLLVLGLLYSFWGGGSAVRQSLANITLPGGVALALARKFL